MSLGITHIEGFLDIYMSEVWSLELEEVSKIINKRPNKVRNGN